MSFWSAMPQCRNAAMPVIFTANEFENVERFQWKKTIYIFQTTIMTFFHFINCLALSYAPYFIVFKYSGLSEYSTVWKCAQASFAYLGVQLCKLLFLATFFPAFDNEGQQFDFSSELLKSLVDVADLIGLYLIMAYNVAGGKGAVRFIVSGLGWAFADGLATKLVPLWVGARGVGFDWKYTQLALESNLDMIVYLSIAALVWLWGRYDLPREMRQACAILLTYCTLRNFVYELLVGVGGLHSWSLLFANSVLTLTLASCTTVIYASLHRNVD